MSNIETPTTPAPAAPAPSVADTITAQQAGIAPPAPGDTIDRARYDAEVANHIRERNFWKPAQQLFAGLDEGSQQHLLALADAARRGDVDAILELSEQTISAASEGRSAADVIAERHAARRATETALTVGAPAPTGAPSLDRPAQAPALSADDVAEMVRNQIKMQAVQAEVASTMTNAGFPLDTAAGKAIIQYCFENRCDPQTGIDWFKADLVARGYTPNVAGQVAAAAGMQLPGTAPAGTAAGGAAADNLTPRERAIARIERSRLAPG